MIIKASYRFSWKSGIIDCESILLNIQLYGCLLHLFSSQTLCNFKVNDDELIKSFFICVCIAAAIVHV